MKIAYNPKTAAALTTAPANNDITFDLSGLSIYVKGVRFKGTDTTYSVFKKHGSSGDGYNGLVPVPNYNNDSKTRFLREDGTWVIPTDSHYTTHLYVGAQSVSNNNNSNVSTTNGNTYIKLFDNSTLRHLYLIKGSGNTTVNSDASGNITINSPTTISWSNVTGKPGSFTPATHYHDYLKGWLDTRGVATTPNDYNGYFKVVGIKTSGTTLGLNYTQAGNYATIIGWRGWADKSGGYAWEIASTDKNRLYVRSGSNTTWDNGWSAIAYTTDLTWSNISGKPSTFAPSAHNHPTSQINALTSYTKATAAAALATTDSLNSALGKLEYKLDVAYDLVTKANDSDGTIENLKEILDVLSGISDTDTIKNIIGKYLPLAGGTMSGNISFKSIASWPTASGETYPINSRGISWSGSSDTASIFYRVRASNDGLQIFLLGDDVSGDWIFEYTTGQTAATINKDGITAPTFYGKLSYTNLTGSGTTANQAIVSTGTANGWTLKTLGSRAFDSTAYLPLTGGTMALGEGLKFHADENYFGTNLDARIISLLDGNGTTCDGGLIIDERATSNGIEHITELLRIRHEQFLWKGNVIWHAGNDGSGSGLDADLLDGKHARDFAIAGHTHNYASIGSVVFTPANTELTPLLVLALTGGWSIKKGTWDYAGNGYIVAGSFGNIDLAGTSVLTFGNNSAYTQLYITAPTQSGHSGKTNEIFFYNNHGSNYSPAWTRVITNRNYNSYSPTLTGTGASGTWGINITGNAGSSTYPAGFTSRGTSDWSGVPGTLVTDWSVNGADIMFKYDGPKLNVITDGRFYQGIDIYGASKRVLDEYDINHTTWGNADTVDRQHFNWNNNKNDHTYLWAASSNGQAYLVHRASMSVNYATYSGSLSNNTSTDANTLYRNPGFAAWSVWSTFSNTPTSSYTNGINLNSSDTNYGWLLAKPAFVDRPYYRGRLAGSFTSWKEIAFTSDIPTVTNYYWANIKVSASSSTSTSPTFQECYANGWFRSTGNNGWYNPTHSSHIHPNGTTTYGNLVVRGAKSGYTGINLGNSTSHMNVMSTDTHHGLYCENTSQWEFYYNRSSKAVGILTSTITKTINLSGSTYISSTLDMGNSINTASTPGSWVSGMSGAAILYKGLSAIDASSFWRFFNMKSSGGNVVCYGGLGNNIGFYGYYSGRTANGTDWTFTVNTSNGNWTATNSIYAAHFYENSDILLKLNILEILNVDKMPIIKEFDWKESGKHSYGLIALELEEQGYSELVETKEDGYKSVNYSAALSLIIGKLQVKIKELEKEIKNLKNQN